MRDKIMEMQGQSMAQIARTLGVSRQRVHQIVQTMPNWKRRETSDLYKVQRIKYANASLSVPFEEVFWSEVCPYLGIEIDYYAERKQDNSPAFEGNLVISSKAKQLKKYTIAELSTYIDKIIKSNLDCQ